MSARYEVIVTTGGKRKDKDKLHARWQGGRTQVQGPISADGAVALVKAALANPKTTWVHVSLTQEEA